MSKNQKLDENEMLLTEEESSLIKVATEQEVHDDDINDFMLTGDDVLKAGKMTPTQKNALLFEAASLGDVEKLKLAIAYGANINAQERASPYETALSLAIKAGKNSNKTNDAIKFLIKSGCFCQNSSYSYGNTQAKAIEKYKDQLKNSVADLISTTLKQMIEYSDADILDWASDYYKANYNGYINFIDKTEIVNKSMSLVGFSKALYFIKKYNALPSEKSFDYLSSAFSYQLGPNNQSVFSIREREAGFEILKTASKNIASSALNNIFKSSIENDDLDLLKILFKSGYKPKNWGIVNVFGGYYNGKYEARNVETNILLKSLGSGNGKCFNYLKKINFLIELMVKSTPSPLLLSSKYSITELLILSELGLDICVQDKEGKNFLHYWADMDKYQPRNGWATMLRKYTKLVEQKDNNGHSAKDYQIKILRSNTSGYYAKMAEESVLKFEKSLTKIESQLIKKEIGKLKSKKVNKEDPPIVEKKRVRL